LNIGVEAGLFQRMTVNLEYYNKQTNDLLFARPLAPSSGNSSYDANIGGINNAGFEIELSYQIFKGDFNWTLNLNGSRNINKFTELPEEGITIGTKRYEVGKSIYEFYLPQWAGVNDQTGQAQWYKNELDANGDETGNKIVTSNYAEATRYFSGTALPDFRGGISNSFEFMNFDLTILTSYSIGGKIYDSPYAGLMGMGDFGNNYHQDMENAWTTPGQKTDIPQLNVANRDFTSQSTRFLRDASYFNITNINLGYSFDKTLMKSVGVESLRVYVTADNLYTFTTFKGIDPRQSLNGVMGNQYTPMRTISAGVNLNL
jgi:hypothetical protein